MLKLLHEIPGEDGNERIYLELEDGRKLPLPYHWRTEEFTLPGNVLELKEVRGYAIYDETTRSGLLFCGIAQTPYWQALQPVTREHFFDEQVPLTVEGILQMRRGLGLP